MHLKSISYIKISSFKQEIGVNLLDKLDIETTLIRHKGWEDVKQSLSVIYPPPAGAVISPEDRKPAKITLYPIQALNIPSNWRSDMISPLKTTKGIVMSICSRFHAFVLMLGLILTSATNTAFSDPTNEPEFEKILIPLSSSPEFTFTVPMKSRVSFFLPTSKNTKGDFNSAAQITISDYGCALGHQVSVTYDKTNKEILTAYFPKEIPWGTTYKLAVSRDIKTHGITLVLNGETIIIQPYKKAKFIYLPNNPKTITLLNIEQH